MLIAYRRHEKRCPHQGEGRGYRRCRCPIWVQGTLTGQYMRKSTGLRDWEKAQCLIREWEAEGNFATKPDEPPPVTVEQAWQRFLADVEARGLHPSTARKYRLLSRRMQDFAQNRGLGFLNQFDLDTLSAFRAEWQDGPLSRAKKLERLRGFFRFAQKRRWVAENPASELKAPKIPLRPTLPFSCDEMLQIWAALGPYAEQTAPSGKDNARRLPAFVGTLRYSGLRIGDVVKLRADQISGNRLLVRTEKTGVPVYVVLPDFVARIVEATPRTAGTHLFWDGVSNLESVTGSWRKRLAKLFQLAKVPDGHAHRFRDTFAVELLLAGVPIEGVSVLLGHSSVKVTEKYYAPWTHSRRQQVEADLERAWRRDPVVLLETKGTQQVRGKSEAVN